MNRTIFKDQEFTMRELCEEMPKIAIFETTENAKEGYQDIQLFFDRAYERVSASGTELSHEELSFYLLALAGTAPQIDDEVFDHKMNLVTQYRTVLKNNISVFEGWDKDSVRRVRESIKIACESGMLLKEKYEKYIEEQ